MENQSPFQATEVARRHLEAGRIRLIETEHRQDTTTGWHSHPELRLCLVVAGGFDEADPRGSWYRGPGTLLLYPARTSHDNRFSCRGARCLNIEVPDVEEREAGANRRERVTELGTPEAYLGMQIYDGLRSGRARHVLVSLAEKLVTTVRRGDRHAHRLPEWLEQGRCLLEERATDGIGLSGLADALGVSRFVLARRFREYFGCSVGEYRHRVLVQRARHALLTSDASLSTIAYRLGFSDQSHFTRVFKRLTSLPPGRYRATAN